MKIFFAGAEQKFWWEKLIRSNVKHLLLTFDDDGEISKKPKRQQTVKEEKKEHNLTLFLDSGAFGAWNKGSPIRLKDYIAYLEKTSEIWDVYANLDVIGNAEATYKNQLEMEEAGLSPLPCFHYMEDFKWLHLYCSKYEHLALGGMVGINRDKLSMWLTQIFDQYSDNKFHGFGINSEKLIRTFPFYSVDSTSYISTSRFGSIPTPWGKINVSMEANLKTTPDHFMLRDKEEQKEIKKFVKEMGFSLTSVATDYRERDSFTVSYLLKILHQIKTTDKWQPTQRLFDLKDLDKEIKEEKKEEIDSFQQKIKEELKELKQRIIKGTNYLADLVDDGRIACQRTILCIDCEKPKERRDLYCIAKSKLQRLEREYNELSGN